MGKRLCADGEVVFCADRSYLRFLKIVQKNQYGAEMRGLGLWPGTRPATGKQFLHKQRISCSVLSNIRCKKSVCADGFLAAYVRQYILVVTYCRYMQYVRRGCGGIVWRGSERESARTRGFLSSCSLLLARTGVFVIGGSLRGRGPLLEKLEQVLTRKFKAWHTMISEKILLTRIRNEESPQMCSFS